MSSLLFCKRHQRISHPLDIQDVIDGKVCLPFTSRVEWLSMETECPGMHRAQAYLKEHAHQRNKPTSKT